MEDSDMENAIRKLNPKALDKKTEVMKTHFNNESEEYNRPSWDEYFLEIAKLVGSRGTCDRGRNGAVIVKNKRIITTGYVGAPMGMSHCDEVGHLMSDVVNPDGSISKHCVRTLHAEQNAIIQAALHGVSTDGATLYVKFEPCFTCLPIGQYVYNDFEPIKVENINSSNKLLSLTGISKIEQTFRRQYNGDIIVLKPRGLFPIKITPEHPILVYNGKKIKSRLHINAVYKCQNKAARDINVKEQWVDAKNVQIGDYLVLPKIKGNGSCTIDFKACTRYPWTERMNKKMQKPQKVDKRLAWLLGWYLAEGHSCKERRGGVKISLGKHEVEYLKKLIKISKSKFGCVSVRNAKTATEIMINSGVLARFFRQNFGPTAPEKKIPSWFFELSEDIIHAFLQGYILGDGALSTTNYGYNYIEISTVSKYLPFQLPLLFAKLGIVPSVYELKERVSKIDGREIRNKNQIYMIVVAGNPVKKIFSNAKVAKIDKKNFIEMKDKLLVPVRDIKHERYEGPVFNFETTDNTYCIPFVVHNCAKILINAGIKRVVCQKKYHAAELTRKFFKEAGVEIVYMEDEVEDYPNQ